MSTRKAKKGLPKGFNSGIYLPNAVLRELYEPRPTDEDFESGNLDRQRQVDGLLDCVKSIKKIRENLGAIEVSFNGYELYPQDNPPWRNKNSERGILRRRHMERRHLLLGQALADLLDVISSEVGVSAVDGILYPENCDPIMLADTPDTAAKE